MNTKLILVADERGFTVQLSTTHQTQAGALAHFTEVLAQLHHQHPATTAANTATPAMPAATAEGSGHEHPPTQPRPGFRSIGNRSEEPPF